VEPGVKRCSDCGKTKPLTDFPRNKNSRDGVHCHCKPCHNARGRETRQRLYGGSRHYHLRRKYGMGAAEVQALLDAQGGICPVCLKRPATQVDHDHKTGRVRGVLCLYCNAAMGAFHDDPDLIAKAIAYLERYRA
jgi:recombination endonuclease VII